MRRREAACFGILQKTGKQLWMNWWHRSRQIINLLKNFAFVHWYITLCGHLLLLLFLLLSFRMLSGLESWQLAVVLLIWNLNTALLTVFCCRSSWSGQGCLLTSRNESHTECSCNHLTHFAVLMQFDRGTSGIVLTKVGISLNTHALISEGTKTRQHWRGTFSYMSTIQVDGV